MNKNLQIPATMTPDELKRKMQHLTLVLSEWQYNAVVFQSEGAMRWLTGIKHQLGDIAPAAISPVNACIQITSDNNIKISIIAKSFETPRLKDEISSVFSMVPEIKYEFLESLPELAVNSLLPEDNNYYTVINRIVRPLLDGFSGNQYKKLAWLSNMTMKILAETAHQLKQDMHGLEVRGLLIYNLGKYNIDANLALISLAGQEHHLHPIASSNYKVKKNEWLKLVVGSRFAEHIVSQSLMVKLGGGINEHERIIYCALQDAALEYADCYRLGKTEKNIYAEMVRRFYEVEQKYKLKGFAESATLHHPGGGTSPLGNRDQMLDPNGERISEPWTQFAINPVDTLLNFKVELQGIICPDNKPPLILEMSDHPDTLLNFREVVASGGTTAKLPELLIVNQ